MRQRIGAVAGLVVTACSERRGVAAPGDDAVIDDGTDHGAIPDEALPNDVDDQREEIRKVLGAPDAFRPAFVPVEGGAGRHETWDHLELETRIDVVDGTIVSTDGLEPLADGAYPGAAAGRRRQLRSAASIGW